MTHSVNSLGWLLAVTEAYSRSGKSIEHAVPENAGMITIGKHHCMPILPCLHIVSCTFVLIARGLNDVFCHAKALPPNKLLTNRKSNQANAVSIQREVNGTADTEKTLSDSLCF